MAAIFRPSAALPAVCPDCGQTHSLVPGQAGYQIAKSEALNHASIARIKCGCDVKHVVARAELVHDMDLSSHKIIKKKNGKIKRIVRLISA